MKIFLENFKNISLFKNYGTQEMTFNFSPSENYQRKDF